MVEFLAGDCVWFLGVKMYGLFRLSKMGKFEDVLPLSHGAMLILNVKC